MARMKKPRNKDLPEVRKSEYQSSEFVHPAYHRVKHSIRVGDTVAFTKAISVDAINRSGFHIGDEVTVIDIRRHGHMQGGEQVKVSADGGLTTWEFPIIFFTHHPLWFGASYIKETA